MSDAEWPGVAKFVVCLLSVSLKLDPLGLAVARFAGLSVWFHVLLGLHLHSFGM